MLAIAEGTAPLTVFSNNPANEKSEDINYYRRKVTTVIVVESPILCGDANADGLVDILDALMVAQCYVGLSVPVDCTDLRRLDVNGDGFINIVDALVIAQYYVGLNPPFCRRP